MIRASVAVFTRDDGEPAYESGDVAAGEITDRAWCEEEHGPGFVELKIPLRGRGDVYVRFRVVDFVEDLARHSR